MTAGDNGASTPEDDDPFGYLYEDGHAAGATPPSGRGRGYGYPGPAAQPGVPRTSYNHVRAVGERQYGGQQIPQQGHPQQPQGQQAYGQQPHGQQPYQANPQYAAPETYPGGAPTRSVPQQPAGGRGGGRGPNTKGLLIGAIAVVAAVLIGIGVALMDKDKDADTAGGEPDKKPTSAAAEPPKDGEKESQQPQDQPGGLPKRDAATLQLGPPASLDTKVKGAKGGTKGAYVSFNGVGGSATWNAHVAAAGEYRLYVRYSIPAKDANATLTVNGKVNGNPLGLKNFISSDNPDLEKNWQTTWAPVTLQGGKNVIKISCEDGNQCDAILDWVEVRSP